MKTLSPILFLALFLFPASAYSWEAKVTPKMIGGYQEIFRATVAIIQRVEAKCPNPDDAKKITFDVTTVFKGSPKTSFVYNEATVCGQAALGLAMPVLEKGREYYVLTNDTEKRPRFIRSDDDREFHDVIAAINALKSTPAAASADDGPTLQGKAEKGDVLGTVKAFRNYDEPAIALSQDECAKAPTDLEFLQQQAAAGNEPSREKLAAAFYRGQAGTKRYEDAYFWALVSADSSPETSLIIKDVPKFLTSQQVAAEEKRAAEWKSAHPVSTKVQADNVLGMLCGKSWRCKVADTCGDLVGIDCDTLDDGPYLFASKTTKKIIGSCGFGCKVPADWTCGNPKRF